MSERNKTQGRQTSRIYSPCILADHHPVSFLLLLRVPARYFLLLRAYKRSGESRVTHEQLGQSGESRASGPRNARLRATYAKEHVPTEAAWRMESIGGLVAKNPARVTQIRFSQAGNDTAALLWWLEIRVLTRGLDPRT